MHGYFRNRQSLQWVCLFFKHQWVCPVLCSLCISGSTCSLRISGSACSLNISGSACSFRISASACSLRISASACSLCISGSTCSLRISGSACSLRISDRLHFWLIITWLIWLTVLPSGEVIFHTQVRKSLTFVIDASKILGALGSFSSCVVLLRWRLPLHVHHADVKSLKDMSCLGKIEWGEGEEALFYIFKNPSRLMK